MLEFQVLGPLAIRDGDLVVPVRGRGQQLLLAAMVLQRNRLTSLDRLLEAVWHGARPPSTGEAQIRDRVRLLRKLLAGCPSVADPASVLATMDGGYRLVVPPGGTDVERFQAVAGEGRASLAAGRFAEAAGLLQGALAVWRDTPFAGLEADWLRAPVAKWTELRQAVLEDRIDAQLGCGRYQAVVGELSELVAAYPLRERLRGQQMVTLAAIGRVPEALAAFADARRTLAEELGVDPGPELQRLHQQLLRGEAVAASPVGVERHAPAQLPRTPFGFVGRDAALAELDRLLDDAVERPAAVLISALSGMAGVGKTALALHWSHRVAERFPDGQLYVNLRGFGPAGQVTPPTEAVRGFLTALGVAPQRVPQGLDAQTGLYRSLMSGKRMLVVLDNARDVEQVRPLLPGTSTALTVVTSRSRLTGLVAADGAYPVALDPLCDAEARELLARRLGRERVDNEPAAVERIIAGCARLPLALAIVAARALDSGLSLAALSAEIDRAGARLDALDGGDPTSQIRAVFSWSYQGLSPAAAALFRLLGVHPGPDISAAAAASLAGRPAAAVDPLLAELVRANLMGEHVPGRYAFHDLVRVYAGELASDVDSAARRRAATHRLLDHYLHTGHRAALLLEPTRSPLPLAAPKRGVGAEPLADRQEARKWFARERAVLPAAIELAVECGFDAYSCNLAWTMANFLDWRGEWAEWVAIQRTSVEAAQRLADPVAEASARRMMASAYTRLGQFDEASVHLQHALDLHAALDDPLSQAHTYARLAHLRGRQGNQEQALDHARRALDLYRATGHRRGEASALNAIGWHLVELGRYREAITPCEQSLALSQELDDRLGVAGTWDTLGLAYHHLGAYTDAIAYLERAVNLYRELDVRHYLAVALMHLGDSRFADGDRDAAGESWRPALAILDEIGGPEAGEVRARLAALGDTAPVVSGAAAAR